MAWLSPVFERVPSATATSMCAGGSERMFMVAGTKSGKVSSQQSVQLPF
jgi:hypothetical protein